jgi:hypothetical protein
MKTFLLVSANEGFFQAETETRNNLMKVLFSLKLKPETIRGLKTTRRRSNLLELSLNQ